MPTIFEIEATLPPNLRQHINQYCALRGYTYRDILKAERGDIWQMGKVHGLICHLAKKHHSLRWITYATQLDKDKVLKVLEELRKPETRIRTFDYERLA